MLRQGMYVKTSYETGPYVIKSITRGCTCPKYLDDIECYEGGPPPSKPHIHLVVKRPGERSPYFLNGFDEETLRSVWDDDYLIIVKNPFKQMTLPF